MQNFQKRIKQYNQILLALGGTAALLLLLAIGAFILADEFFRRFRQDPIYQEGVISSQQTSALLADSLRKQIISFDNITLLDSATSTYILPVRQATLKDSEAIGYEEDLNSMISESSYKKHRYGNRSVFNNLVIYNSKQNTSDLVFSERVSIMQYVTVSQNDQQSLLIIGTNKNTNQDKFLNPKDLQTLFVYQLATQQLTPIPTKEHATVLSIFENKKTKDIIAKIGMDKNKNGSYEQRKEPVVFFKFDLGTMAFVPVVGEGQMRELQRLLEGRSMN